MEVPPYCYYKPHANEDQKLWFNKAAAENTAAWKLLGPNTSPCTERRRCVCKNGIQGKIKQELISIHFPWKLVNQKQNA